MRRAVTAIWTLLFGVVLALLPGPERDRIARETGLDAARCSFLLGLVEGLTGLSLYVLGGLAFMRASAAGASMAMLEHWWAGLTSAHFGGAGVTSWIVWPLVPAAWPSVYLAVVGLVRVAAFVITREAVGEPAVIVILRGVQRFRRTRARARKLRELGPERPDELDPLGSGWRVLTARPKVDWGEQTTVEIDGRHYRIADVAEIRRGPWTSIAYRLEPQPDHAIVRRLVVYDPPTDVEGDRAAHQEK